MSDSTRRFVAVSGSWSVDLETDENGELKAVNFVQPKTRPMACELPELVFRVDDPMSKAVVRGTASNLAQQTGDPDTEDEERPS
jgi:hypothetical protein